MLLLIFLEAASLRPSPGSTRNVWPLLLSRTFQGIVREQHTVPATCQHQRTIGWMDDTHRVPQYVDISQHTCKASRDLITVPDEFQTNLAQRLSGTQQTSNFGTA